MMMASKSSQSLLGVSIKSRSILSTRDNHNHSNAHNIDTLSRSFLKSQKNAYYPNLKVLTESDLTENDYEDEGCNDEG